MQHVYLTLLMMLRPAWLPMPPTSVWAHPLSNGSATLGNLCRSSRENFHRYNVCDRELTAIYEAVRHFRYFLEGQTFTIVTDHKPLIYMFSQRVEKIPQRQRRQIAFISQFSTNIKYQPGDENIVADSLSRVESIRVPMEFSLVELAEAQTNNDEAESGRSM